MKKIVATVFILFGLIVFGNAQKSVHFTLISDDLEGGKNLMETQIKEEIEALLMNTHELTFDFKFAAYQSTASKEMISAAMANPKTDIVIGIGLITCNNLTQLDNYPKPTLLTIIADNKLQKVPITPENTSGVNNFTYVQSPFNIERDLATLKKIVDYENVAVIGTTDLLTTIDFNSFLAEKIAKLGAKHTYVPISNEVAAILEKVPADVQAVYILPDFRLLNLEQLAALQNGLAARGLPVFSLISTPNLDLGAYAAYSSEENLLKIPRRTAINVSKILDGQNAADLSVVMESFNENLFINMQAVNKTKVYPSWDLMSEATLLNVNKLDTDREISLRSAVAEGLENNLAYHIAQKQTRISQTEIGIARSTYLPQIDATTTGVLIDQQRSDASFGTQGRFSWSAGASASQLILSEPALANIAIQKLLLESQEYSEKQTQLDLVLNTATGFLNVLQAEAFFKLQNENVGVTKKNYDLAKTKEKVGYSGTTDVYRWESQLALNNVDLINAQATLRQSRFSLNEQLNRPIKEAFNVVETNLGDSLLMVSDPRLASYVDNPGKTELFGDFLVAEAHLNLPEIKQIEMAVAAQERLLQSQKRAYYTPTIALSAQYDYQIGTYGLKLPPGTAKPDAKPTWNTSIAVQMPIFQGNERKFQKEKTQVGILQLQDQKADLYNKLELQVRANLETAGASYQNVVLSRKAAAAAEKNFEIAQNSYQAGLLNVTSLVDAQNALLQSDINAINAYYQFIIDFLTLERATGSFYFLSENAAQEAYFQRLLQYK